MGETERFIPLAARNEACPHATPAIECRTATHAAHITFICGFCEHPIKAPTTSEGRVGRCPNCHLPVVAPQVRVDSISFGQVDVRRLSSPRLKELFHGVAVSFVFHVMLLSLMGVIILKSPELGRALITTLFLDTEGSEVELGEISLETPTVHLAMVEGDVAWGTDGLSAGEGPIADRLAGTGISGGDSGRIIQAFGSIDPVARFSETAVERLARQPAAKRGDYEIALFWDGPSDLDLHVMFQSTSGKVTRTINYTSRGKPATGFLDVDQNASPPFVNDPIEHIRWDTKSPPSGLYRIEVHGYFLREVDAEPDALVPFTVEVKTPDGVRSYFGEVSQKGSFEIDTLVIENSMGEIEEIEPVENHPWNDAKKKREKNSPPLTRKPRGVLESKGRNSPSSKPASEAKKSFAPEK